MRFSRARYVTLCQQSLVTAAVLAIGVSAAGVKTLDIVPQPTQLAEGMPGTSTTTGTPGAPRGGVTAPLGRALPDRHSDPEARPAPVATAPVKPKVREVEVHREAAPAPRQQEVGGKPVVVLSRPQPVTGYATVGVTWQHGLQISDHDIAVQVRTRKAGKRAGQEGPWSGWQQVTYHDEHGADGEEGDEPGQRPGTDPLVIGDVDQVQMRAETSDGRVPADMQLAVIDPGQSRTTTAAPAIDTAALDTGAPSSGVGSATAAARSTAQSTLGASDTAVLSASTMAVAPKPLIYSRAQWGADESLREQSPPSYGTIKTGFIHHTVNANNYTADQVPALLRGIYAYHVESRGWRDIGYNFLVDRFGRIWEGRWGGVNRPVVGAHTLGYNEVSFAMSAIGNYDITAPPKAVLDAYARLFAWKLSMYGINAGATHLWVKDRYLHAINGHRDVGQTACPGRYLYARIPDIRTAAVAIQQAAQSGSSSPTPAPDPYTTAMTSPTQTPLPAKAQPTDLKLSQPPSYTGSSLPDLLLGNRSGAVYVQPTGGQTQLGAPIRTTGPWARMNLVSAIGDVTGDGHSDLLGRIADTTRVYPGDGRGHFATTGIRATQVFANADQVVTAGDWNRDNRQDVLMRTRAGRLYMVPGTGAGRFGQPVLVRRGWADYRSTAVAGDLDGNGTPDVVAANTDGKLYFLPSTAKGGLGARRVVGTAGTANVYGGAGDLTGDKVPDVLWRKPRGRFYVAPGVAGGTLGSRLGPFGASGLVAPSAAPVTGAGVVDLVGLNSTRSVLEVLPSNGRPNLRPLVRTNVTTVSSSQLLDAGDWDGDGRRDLVTRAGLGGNRLYLRRGKGGGQFGDPVLMIRGWRDITNLAAVGDVTGDGKPDLVGRRADGAMTIFPGNGRTGFLRPQLAPRTLETFNQIGAGTWRSGGLPGSALIGSDGSFVPMAAGTGGDPAGYDWVIGPGDLDGDGNPDVVARDRGGRLWLKPGTADGFGTRRLVATGFGSWALAG